MLQYLKLVSSSSQDSTPDLRHRGLLSGRRPGRDQLHRGRVQARGADLLGGQWEKGTFKLSHVANAMKVLQAFICQSVIQQIQGYLKDDVLSNSLCLCLTAEVFCIKKGK